jgi:hypothetical protein
VAILGSPGVGKSVFLMLLAFYLAHVHSKSVIVLRKLKGGRKTFACVRVYKEGYSGSSFSEKNAFISVRDQHPESLFFVDGFTYEEVNSKHDFLGAFNLLATSSQYRVKGDDSDTRCILLPAWRLEDLKGYLEASLPKNLSSDQRVDQVKEKFETPYFYSGGSLRLFLDSHKSRENLILSALDAVKNEGADVLLRERAAGTKSQVDLLRKRFLKDCTDPTHYETRAQWVTVVDSVFALRKLRDMISLKVFSKTLAVAKGVRGAFYGLAFEQYIHKKAYEGLSFRAVKFDTKLNAVEEDSKRDAVDFHVSSRATVCAGEGLDDCYKYLEV